MPLVCALREPLRSVIEFLKHSGCRPQELRAIEADWVDGAKIVFPLAESKGNRLRKRKQRVGLSRLDGRCDRGPTGGSAPPGPIFRNSKGGRGLTKCVVQAFDRLSEHVGFCVIAYSFRHAYITSLLRRH